MLPSLIIHLKVASISAGESACVGGHCLGHFPLGQIDILMSRLTSHLHSIAGEL